MTDHQFRQLLETLQGIDTSLSSIARALADLSAPEPEEEDLKDVIERGRFFGKNEKN